MTTAPLNLGRRSTVQRAYTLRSHDLGCRVLSGASFQFLGIGLRTIITIGSTAILARLLVPADFGHVAMATVVTELAALFANFGLANILIQRKHIARLHLDTVFWATLMIGAALGSLLFAFSFVASWLFADPKVGDLLRLLCVTFPIGGLTVVPWVVLSRLLRFRTEFLVQITTVAVRSAIALACAWNGMGAWSLVAGAISGVVVQALLGFIAVPYLPRLRFHVRFLESTWRTSGSYFGGGILFYANMNLDLMLIGRQLGAESLGYYQNARTLTDEIRARIAIPLQHVLFPAFSTVQTNRERMQSMFLRSSRILAAMVIPTGIGIAAMAQELVPVLYGDQWLAMISPLAFLGISGAIRASTVVASVVIIAHDKVTTAFKYQFIGTILMVAAITSALPYGLNGVATAQMLVAFYSIAPFRYALRLIGLGMRDGWQILGPPLVASLALAAVVALLRLLTTSWFDHPGPQLLFHAAVAAFVYIVVLHLISRQYLLDFRDIAIRLMNRS
jgi:PST family polysaccharide transporter